MNKLSKIKYIGATFLLVLAVFGTGLYLGLQSGAEESFASVLGKEKTSPEKNVDLAKFWKVWKTIDEKYPGAEEISEEARIEGAISGLLLTLDDPYSVYYNKEEAKSFREDISGSFIGVGMEVGLKDRVPTVIAPLKNTPAERAGIKPGDRILEIDGVTTIGDTLEQTVRKIRGERGTTVVFTVSREGEEEPIKISIARGVINIPTLDIVKRPDGIFVIKLYSFSASSPNLFRNALRDFADSKMDKLVIDLRGNPGGYLDAAISVSSWFLPSGKVIVTEDKGENVEQTAFRSKGYNAFGDNLKVVILIDNGSASASEIVAGALRDHKKALLVGDTSFGKGSVQEVISITGETLLKITIAKWLTPGGISISEKGLEPDYKVVEDKNPLTDLQMNKAVELLKSWPGIK